jgi:small subunit ribosomal protein S15
MHEGDVGSAQVQVAIANERLGQLTRHLLANKKDMSAKRGLQVGVICHFHRIT